MTRESNMQSALRYLKYDPIDCESVITQDFVGHGPNGFVWDRAAHIDFVSKIVGTHTVKAIVADNETVSAHIVRDVTFMNYAMKNTAMMLFMRISDGKVAEIWELWERPATAL